jgi:hypothetical protein
MNKKNKKNSSKIAFLDTSVPITTQNVAQIPINVSPIRLIFYKAGASGPTSSDYYTVPMDKVLTINGIYQVYQNVCGAGTTWVYGRSGNNADYFRVAVDNSAGANIYLVNRCVTPLVLRGGDKIGIRYFEGDAAAVISFYIDAEEKEKN